MHLYNHERQPNRAEENVVGALRDHLRWSEAKAQQVLVRSLDHGLVVRQGDRLGLTPKGREVAREILEPWRQGGADVGA